MWSRLPACRFTGRPRPVFRAAGCRSSWQIRCLPYIPRQAPRLPSITAVLGVDSGASLWPRPQSREEVAMIKRLRDRDDWKFFGVLRQTDRLLALSWWSVLLLRGLLPALFAIVMGALVGAVQRGDPLAGPLGMVGVVFVLLQVRGEHQHDCVRRIIMGSRRRRRARGCCAAPAESHGSRRCACPRNASGNRPARARDTLSQPQLRLSENERADPRRFRSDHSG